MYYFLTTIVVVFVVVVFVLLIPEFIKFARIKHLKSLGYRYEGDRLVSIQKDN